MTRILFGLILGFLIGATAAYINYRLTLKPLNGGSAAGFVPLLRIAVDAAALAAVYFITPYTPFDRTWSLAGTAAGLTLPLLLFTPMLLKKMKGDTSGGMDNDADPAKKNKDSDKSGTDTDNDRRGER